MIFLLPQTSPYTYKYLNYEISDKEPQPFISESLSHYLQDIKEKINFCEKEWDVYKKYTNPYEYIHTNVPYTKRSVSKYKPLSRSYFKMIEMIHQFQLIPIKKMKSQDSERPINTYKKQFHNDYSGFGKSQETKLHPIRTFHIAEGPGGFIEAVVNMRKYCTSVPPGLGLVEMDDEYIGMTLEQDPTGNVHGWRKSEEFLKNNPRVKIEHGKTQTGDILKIENFEYCYQKYKNTMDFITADGGFDFSSDFNKQELSVSNLLYAQMAFALCLQKKGGNFVLKIFDSFHKHTIDILYLLSSFYREVYLVKPQTSRIANSEKYVICKNFIFYDASTYYPYLHKTFSKMVYTIENPIQTPYFVTQYLAFPIPKYYLSKLEECVSVFGQQQLENIHYTITLIYKNIKSDKIDQIIRTNVSKCILWCTMHNIPFNPAPQNTFLIKRPS